MARHYSLSEKAGIVSSYQSSNQSLKSFSASIGISPVTLRSWLNGSAASGSGFSEIVPPAGALPDLLVMEAGAVHLRFGTLPPAAWFAEVLKGLS